ncbi:MAG: TolC family protein [Candidatus Krumholzibacteriia bacterium]
MTRLGPILILLLAASGLAETLPVDDVDALVAAALADHPAVAAAAADGDMAAARVRVAGSLPDPVVMWGEMLEPVETRVGPQQRVLSVQQMVPWAGTLAARREAASALGEAASATEADVAVTVAANVYRAWARAAWLADQQDLVGRQLTLLASLERSLRAGYEAGSGRYSDLLQVQLEQARLADRLRGLADEAPAALARLNAALGRDPAAPLTLPTGLEDAPPLVASTGSVHPQLVALDRRARAAEFEARAAVRAGRPQFTLGLDWIQIGEAVMDGVADSGKDALVARLGMTLPIWRGKYDGARQAAEASRAALSFQREARRQNLAARTLGAEVDRRDADRRVRLHRDDLLPRARQAYEATLAAYRAGGGSLADVIGAERTLLSLEESLVAARRDAWLATADLNEAAGTVPGPASPMKRSEP